VQELKEELAMMDVMTRMQQHLNATHDSSSSGDTSSSSSSSDLKYEPFSDAQRAKLRETVLAWLQQPNPEVGAAADDCSSSSSSSSTATSLLSGLPLGSVRQLRELLLMFRVSCSYTV
jgi:hypothetical protein